MNCSILISFSSLRAYRFFFNYKMSGLMTRKSSIKKSPMFYCRTSLVLSFKEFKELKLLCFFFANWTSCGMNSFPLLYFLRI